MTAHPAARRYARALIDVALKEQIDLSRVEDDLDGFADLLRQHTTLDHVLANPAVPAPRKRAVVAELTSRLRLVPVVAKLLTLLAERDRLALLPDLRAAYRAQRLAHQQVVWAEVTTAVPLTAERVEATKRGLERVTGRDVVLETKVDPAILGGVVARVGSTVYDASVTRQLAKIRNTLRAE